MYNLSRKPVYIKQSNVNTRGNLKTKFRQMSKCSGKYLGSPLYRGSILWDKLDKNVQDLPTIRGFSNVIMKGCKVYVDLIN